MKKSFIITSLTALAALCLCVTAQAQGPVVVSDKDDYSPGETAMFQASGFQPNELLDFSVAVSDDNGGWVPDIAWADISADASGGAEVDYVVPQTWADKRLQLTVMGLSSGLMATTTFTDSGSLSYSPGSISLSASPSPCPNTVSFTQSVTAPSGNGSFMAALKVAPTGVNPIPMSWVSASPTSLSFDTTSGNDTKSWTVTFTVPMGATPGVYTAQIKANPPPGGPGEASGTAVTLTVTACTGCTNTPPSITCLMPTKDLGAVVGCLGTGTGFGQTFPISYTQDGPGTNVTVTAHITLPDTSVVDVDVATVSDDDGDSVSVSLSNEINSVTLNGPGHDSQPFSVTIDADDSQTCDHHTQNTCTSTLEADIVYDFHGFFPPLHNDSTTKVKQGSAVPVKFQIFDCSGTPITPNNIPGGVLPMIDVTYLSGAAPAGLDIDDAGNSNGDTLYFRYDWTDMQWIFNNKTNSTYHVGCSYLLWAILYGDPTLDPNAPISIK